jgi:ADP-dependent NAD(P)H-hydrate dehydratase
VRPADLPPDATPIDATTLRAHPLPGNFGDKDERGAVVVVGGEAETPGGVVLASLGALRAGAGRAHVVTDGRIAPVLAVSAPELRVSAVPGPIGAPDLSADPGVPTALSLADVVVVGTGCIDPTRAMSLLRQCVALVREDSVLVVDAAALSMLDDEPGALGELGSRAILLPNPTEAGRLLGRSRESIDDDPRAALADIMDRFGATVAVRGSTTWVGDPDQGPYVECGGHAALGTAGSGDVLVGVVAGLVAGGAAPLDALVWGVHAHAAAGASIADRHCGVGLLARELLDVLPVELNRLRRQSSAASCP